ncbi:hypothetical protein [Stenotrophomonas sp. SY1]|uniref:hypothetical protein n=1 Tax=Stenotrophomonas sp. SY1 TaxID=477235 RepID=UPI001E2F5786|nr:hypothetical protein [Stenotrophomonas sp. SY1]MCD9086367.1 hypothetical protein [Stenotrophomonas sp. SY1]
MEQPHAALRSRFSAMDTEALMQIWREQALEPWAEAVLQGELQARGIDDEALQKASQLRQAPPLPKPLSIRDTFVVYGMLLPFGCGVFGTALYTMLVGSTGPRIASIAVFATFLVYLSILVRRLLAHSRHTRSAGNSILLALLWIKAGVVSLFAFGGLAILVFG